MSNVLYLLLRAHGFLIHGPFFIFALNYCCLLLSANRAFLQSQRRLCDNDHKHDCAKKHELQSGTFVLALLPDLGKPLKVEIERWMGQRHGEFSSASPLLFVGNAA
jgi:hypothetical protein